MSKDTNPDQRPFTEAEKKVVKLGFSDEEKNEMVKFCHLDFYDGNTEFIDVKYDGGRIGRTCLILGPMGLHARIIGTQRGIVYNERMALEQEKEENFDYNISVKRIKTFGVTIRHRKPDWSTNKDLSEAEIEAMPKYNYDVIVSYHSGFVTIHGLNEPDAIVFKKIIWNWINFVQRPQNKTDQQ